MSDSKQDAAPKFDPTESTRVLTPGAFKEQPMMLAEHPDPDKHWIGESLPIPSDIHVKRIADTPIANSAGTSPFPARADHVHGGYNITSHTSGWVVAANWTLSSTIAWKMGPLRYVRFVVVRAISALTIPVNGDIGNVAVMTSGPSEMLGNNGSSMALVSGATGRVAHGYITPTTNAVALGATAPGSNIGIGESMELGGLYVADL